MAGLIARWDWGTVGCMALSYVMIQSGFGSKHGIKLTARTPEFISLKEQ
jgi:hypothetical protein